MAQSLIDQHGGQVPQTMDELTALAGVGRKTANVVLGNAFGQNVGVTVDTHVTRLSNRLKLTSHAVDAVKIERDLMDVVPQEQWTLWSHLLILHGRAICQARKPKCETCVVFGSMPVWSEVFSGAQAKANAVKIRFRFSASAGRPMGIIIQPMFILLKFKTVGLSGRG